MFKLIFHKIEIFVYYIIVAVLLEMAMFLSLGIGIVPEYWIYDFAIIGVIAGIIFIIPSYVVQAVIAAILFAVQLVIFYVNYSLYSLYGDVFSFDMIYLFVETAKAMSSDFTFIWLLIALVAAYIAVIVGLIFITRRKRKNPISLKKHFSIVIVALFVFMQIASLSTVFIQRNIIHSTGDISESETVTDSFLMDTATLKISSMKKFGFFGYYTNNILNTLTNSSNISYESAVKYFSEGKIFNENSSDTFGIDTGNNVLMVMMESLEWFALSDGTYNSYTLSSELTPNIYALASEGILANNFFSKSKTNIAEGMGFIGSYPVGKYLEQVTHNANESQYSFTLPNILKENGYITNFFHSNESSFYGRSSTHKKLGFDGVYCWDYDGFGYDSCKWDEWVKEEDFVKSALDLMIPELSNKNMYGDDAKNFFTFYTTVSTHGHYNDNIKNADQAEYKDYVIYGDTVDLATNEREYSSWYQNVIEAYEDEVFINRLVNYQASVVGLDRAIGVLVQQLKDYGIYDDTTIILYSDHNTYYHTLSNSIKGFSNKEYMDIELNTVPFIIKTNASKLYERNSEGYLEIDKFSSAYDLVPTVLDLLGIEFNERYYIGYSMFAVNQECLVDIETGVQEELIVYYSLTGGLISEKMYTLNMVDFIAYDSVAAEYYEQFKQQSKLMLEKLNYISSLYIYNIFE